VERTSGPRALSSDARVADGTQPRKARTSQFADNLAEASPSA